MSEIFIPASACVLTILHWLSLYCKGLLRAMFSYRKHDTSLIFVSEISFHSLPWGDVKEQDERKSK